MTVGAPSENDYQKVGCRRGIEHKPENMTEQLHLGIICTISQDSTEKQNQQIREESESENEGEGERLVQFKELAHTILGTGKFAICKAGWQPGNSGKSCSLKSKICRV